MLGVPMMPISSSRAAVFCRRHREGRQRAVCRSSGERFQDFLAHIVTQQGQHEMRKQPTSGRRFRARGNFVDVEKRLQSFEGKRCSAALLPRLG